MAEQRNSLMQKGESAASDLMTFVLAILRALVLSVLSPRWVVATLRSATGPAENGVGAALYLVVCSFVSMSLPNFVLRRSEGAYENLRFGEIFAPMSFDVVLMRVLPTLLACYALSRYFLRTRPQHAADLDRDPVTDDLPRYLFGAGYAVLIGTVAISTVMLATTPPTQVLGYYVLALLVGLILVVWVLHAGLRQNNELSRGEEATRAGTLIRMTTFVGLLWFASAVPVAIDQFTSPPPVVKPEPGVMLGKVWLDSSGERLRLIVFFVNRSERNVYWRPGAVSILLTAIGTQFDKPGWAISPDSSARSLTAPGAANFIVIESPRLYSEAILREWDEVWIRSDETNNARQDDSYFISLPNKKWTEYQYQWKVKLGYAQTQSARAAIAKLQKAVVP
jgi:hypothetical protein